MTVVSIILPTFNRADTIDRAIDSVLAQSFTDWELIVVDDGSTDDTAAVVRDLDPRIRLVRQLNQGCYVARNTGLGLSRGRFVAFLDSDDEWLPHFLEITMAFFRRFPDDHFVTTEFFEDGGPRNYIRSDIHKISTKFTKLAQAVASPLLELPAGEADDYLRIYSTREPLEEWGHGIAERAGYPHAALYRGHIFEHMRWGYLNWLPVTVLTRHALETIGPFPTHVRSAADYRFLAKLYRHFPANMISLPAAIKHAFAIGGRQLAEGHLATGPAEYKFAVNKLEFFDELFWNERQNDAEIDRIRGHHLLYTARTSLELNMRREALMYLSEARRAAPDRLGVYELTIFLYCVPSGYVAGYLFRLLTRLKSEIRRLMSGEESLTGLLHRVRRKLGRAAG